MEQLFESQNKTRGLVLERNNELKMIRVFFSAGDLEDAKSRLELNDAVNYVRYNHLVVHD